MMTALEAKQKVFRKKYYYELVASRIDKAVFNGADMCKISVEELPLIKTTGTLYEIAMFLTEFGYHTMIEKNTLIISWTPRWTNHTSYVDESDSEED